MPARPVRPTVHVLVRPRTFTLLPVWSIVTALSIATACLAAWSALEADDHGSGAVSAPGRNPADARQEEILRAAIDKPADRLLDQMYASINLRHFAGELPPIPVAWEPRLEEVGHLAGRAFTLEGMFGRLGDKTVILLHPKLQADPLALARALCHEMVHAYLFTKGDSSTEHGPKFQGVLKRLADQRAFVGVVASDEEREQMRAWLDAESARLEAERQDLDRISAEVERERAEVERAIAVVVARLDSASRAGHAGPDAREIEAVTTRRDAYNARAADANSRAQRHREALAEFQRRQDRYNLMIVYPDGVVDR